MNRQPPPSEPSENEAGATLVLTALLVVAMFIMAALVLDLGQLRDDRRSNKGVADVAATAGVGRLQFGPWSGVCKARDFLVGNAGAFSTLDPGTETWTNAATPPAVYASSPCPQVATNPDVIPCVANNPSTWAKLQATAGGGRLSIEIQSGYAMPDPRFAEDLARSGDNGRADQGSCDNLSVIITERRESFFGGAIEIAEGTTRVRSVARLNALETLDFVASLQLLERNECNVLQTGGSNTRIIVHPDADQPGTIQIDSAADAASCPSPILNAQATSGGPSVVACGTQSSNPACRPGTGSRPSRIGIYALRFNRPAGYIATPYPTTYGDTQAIATPRTGREFVDRRYRLNVANLGAQSKSMLSQSLPPGCTVVVLGSCTGTAGTWTVVSSCTTVNLTLLAPTFLVSPRVWFNCDLTVSAPLLLAGVDSHVVINGSLGVSSIFTIVDPHTVTIKGRSTGNKIGVDIGSGGVMTINSAAGVTCALGLPNDAAKMVVGNGSLKVGSGGFLRLCQTFVFLASGFDKVPLTDGTLPCTTPCSTYTGVLDIGSGAQTDWSAPNEIVDRPPEPEELATTNRFEDLAIWSETGGNANGISGQATSKLTGVFFLPNAHSFNLAGGGALPIDLAAQFISRSLKVTGGASINLVPNREDSVAVTVYAVVLVR